VSWKQFERPLIEITQRKTTI